MAVTNEMERRIGERNTQAFIDANPLVVSLFRPQRQRTEAGGMVKTSPLQLPPQKFRIVPMSGLVWDRSRTTPDEGRIDDVTEELIGMPDADVQKADYLECETGGWYRVEHISPVRGFRSEARLRWMATEPID